MNPSLKNIREKEKYLISFFLGFIALFIAIIPVMITENGYFIYYGDYNSQQIPFYTLANNAVRNGQFGWNWFTDLGSDFIGSYAFYLFGSPYFWISTLLPEKLITFSMPVLLCIKHGMASLTAYAFIRKFVRNKNACVIGGLLYAFSGFQIFNIFFNHFQDVTSFFPLMLIALEEHVNNNRKGIFAVIVGAMAVLNYFFFTGQAVFLIIYFLMRVGSRDFNINWKKTLTLSIEAVAGTMIASFILLPSVLIILENYRVREHLYGLDMVLYNDRTRIPRIIQSFFMPVDVPARPNLFNSKYAKWASIGGYFPLFSMVGVIAFIRKNKKHWANELFFICMICAFIPILNSGFYMFNSSYYARWFYMPILIMAMMTAQALDDNDADFSSGIKICGIMLAVFGIISILPEKKDDKILLFDLPRDIAYFGLSLAVAIVFLIFTYIIWKKKKRNINFINQALSLTVISCIGCTLLAVIYGANTPSTAKEFIDASIEGKDSVYEKVSNDNFFRVDMSKDYDNYPMNWGLPSMRAFQSVVSPSIMEFYDKIGVQRDVASRPETSHYTLRGLFSVKYYYQKNDRYKNSEKQTEINIPEELPEFELVESGKYFDVYENKLYIPMGFAYDSYITDEEAEKYGETVTEKALLSVLVLSPEQAEKYRHILHKKESIEISGLNKNDYREICREKQNVASSSFSYDSYGFTSEISLQKPQLVFFSVPYSSGWSAEVNGQPVDVEKVSYGFMAVKADTGENTIVFKYRTPGLYEGSAISIAGLAILIIYLVAEFRNKDKYKNDKFTHKHYYNYNSINKIRACYNYEENLKNNINQQKE
ncbi:MAG: YfhO family protein [Oscillospiraceae bacterium]|nr:YfhO family protein [Oscillospiraceae bacterium]